MAHLDIELPGRFLFATRIPIRIDDLNYGGHLGNDAVLALAQEARAQFLGAHGFTELDVEGTGLLMVEAALLYRAEGRYGMVLRIDIGAGQLRTRGCDLLYRLSDEATGKEIARVRTGLVFQDRASRRLVRIPPGLQAVLSAGAP